MPYRNQYAGKNGHMGFLQDTVGRTLSDCSFLRHPSAKEARSHNNRFAAAPKGGLLPKRCMAIDGSRYEALVSPAFPPARIGFVRVAAVTVDAARYGVLRTPPFGLVDPFEIAALHGSVHATTWTLPGSNVLYKGSDTVADGFRQAFFEQFLDSEIEWDGVGKVPLMATFQAVAGTPVRKASSPSGQSDGFLVFKCPACGHQPQGTGKAGATGFRFGPNGHSISCPACASPIFATDSLRLYEEVTDFATNETALTRLMNVIEILTLAGHVLLLAKHTPEKLSETAFIFDGPLATFGPSSWLSRCLMRFFHDMNADLMSRGYQPFVLFGLQKEGLLMEHARSVDPFIEPGMLLAVDDDYRNSYVRNSRHQSGRGFGEDTYFGQDFLFKSEAGQMYALSVPYPFAHKESHSFHQLKGEISRYPILPHALDLIRFFECGLYRGSIIPVVLAHRAASISLFPGGRVLNAFAEREFTMHDKSK